jgi:hypothetical protein
LIHFEHPRPGEELDWLAVDQNARVGLFSSWGYGPVPLSVAAHLDQVARAVEKLSSLPAIGDAIDVPADLGNYSFWTDPARRGIFGYDWGPMASEPFARIATPSEPILINQIDDREVVVAALLVRLPLDFDTMPRIATVDLNVPLFGDPATKPIHAIREKYFPRREIYEAIAFAEAGGIAVHRNFDSYHGSTIRGFRREKPFLHVIGLRPVLEEWGRLHGLRPEWIQPEKRRKVAHYDVFGPAAKALIERLQPNLDRK